MGAGRFDTIYTAVCDSSTTCRLCRLETGDGLSILIRDSITFTTTDTYSTSQILYEWDSGNNMFFNAQKFQYICFNPCTSLSCNVYSSSSLDIVDYSRHVLDLGIYVSSACSFKFHITNLNKRTKHLTGWIL